MRTLPWKPALVIFALAGCGAAPAPRTAGNTVAAIRSAEEMGARQVPAAALHLQMAREEYAKAVQYVKDDEPTDAKYMLKRSEADAELALALAREFMARQALASVGPIPGSIDTNPGAPGQPMDQE